MARQYRDPRRGGDCQGRMQRTRDDDPDDPVYYVIMHDPEGNAFCVS